MLRLIVRVIVQVPIHENNTAVNYEPKLSSLIKGLKTLCHQKVSKVSKSFTVH